MLRAKMTSGHRTFEVVRELRAAVAQGSSERVAGALTWGRECFGTAHSSRHHEGDETLNDVLNREGKGLLHDAATMGHANIAHRLLVEGMDANAQNDDGNTPLHLAIRNGHGRCVWALLDSEGIDCTVLNNKGQSPLVLDYLLLWTRPAENAVRGHGARALCGLRRGERRAGTTPGGRRKMYVNSIELFHIAPTRKTHPREAPQVQQPRHARPDVEPAPLVAAAKRRRRRGAAAAAIRRRPAHLL